MIILNYANCDMVGHTGVFDAAKAAAETVDVCVGKIVEAILAKGGVVAQGPAHEVVTEEALAQIYGIEINIASVGARQVCVPGSLEDPLGRIEKFETGSTRA